MEKLLSILKLAKPETDIEEFLSSTDLYGQGIVDSFDIIVILDEINAAYNIDLGGADFSREDFMTVESIRSLIERHKQ